MIELFHESYDKTIDIELLKLPEKIVDMDTEFVGNVGLGTIINKYHCRIGPQSKLFPLPFLPPALAASVLEYYPNSLIFLAVTYVSCAAGCQPNP